MTASYSSRSRCTSARAGAPVIQREAPVRVAMRPSRLAASLSVTSGRRARHQAAESGDQLGAGVGLDARLDGDAAPAQPRRAAAAHARIGIAHAEDDAAHAGREDGVGARRRAAVVVAGLERDVQRRAAAARAGITQRFDLTVRTAGAAMVAASDDPPAGDDHGADRRIGTGAPEAPCGRGGGPGA